jgi:hypothetical protein
MPGNPDLGVLLPSGRVNADAARESGAKPAEETPGRVGEGLRGSGRHALTGRRPQAPGAGAEGSVRSGAVATSSTLIYRPAVDTGGPRARPTDQTSEADSLYPAQPEPARRAASVRRALAIWIPTAIVASILCWAAVTVLSRGSHAGRDVHD